MTKNQLESLDTVIVTGYAKAPQGTAMFEVYKHSGIVLEINYRTNVIVDAEFTLITGLAQRYFRKLLIGYDLTNGLDDLIRRIETHYFAPSTNSIIIALKTAYQRYNEQKNRVLR
ncbi:DUF3870 domain-containing protein [Tuberibacillus calidus]|jgi:hypothetical protein|uniref:DUF3870 domain-containing protein n=1 Tax=Tuberibacillus calidus TaxID=340097 RepID=UPI0003F7BF73|nr:DUF3870 domain-containing protein [Tuberibacillus calidus]